MIVYILSCEAQLFVEHLVRSGESERFQTCLLYTSYTTTKNEKVYAGGNTTPSGLYSEGSETFYENNYSFLATANKDNLIDRLGGFVTFGGNLMIQRRTKMNASAGELLVPNLFSLNNGINKPTVTSELIRRKMNSLYGSLQLNWDGYLFLDITARNDWSSTMSKANRSYFYPSVSLSGVISDMVPKLGGHCLLYTSEFVV